MALDYARIILGIHGLNFLLVQTSKCYRMFHIEHITIGLNQVNTNLAVIFMIGIVLAVEDADVALSDLQGQII